MNEEKTAEQLLKDLDENTTFSPEKKRERRKFYETIKRLNDLIKEMNAITDKIS